MSCAENCKLSLCVSSVDSAAKCCQLIYCLVLRNASLSEAPICFSCAAKCRHTQFIVLCCRMQAQVVALLSCASILTALWKYGVCGFSFGLVGLYVCVKDLNYAVPNLWMYCELWLQKKRLVVWWPLQWMARRQTEVCFLGLGQTEVCFLGLRQTEVCFLGLRQTEVCFLGLRQTEVCFLGFTGLEAPTNYSTAC